MPDYPLILKAETGSTNDDARQLAAAGAGEFTVVAADCQTAGKGRLGNSWMSAPGNLFMSMVLRPAADPTTVAQVSFIAAVAVRETLETILGSRAQVQIKWPNDILVDGRKACGILLESETGALIVGIGINVVSAPEGAAFLHQYLEGVTAAGVLADLRPRLISRYNEWVSSGYDFLPVRAAWLSAAHRLNGEIRVRVPGETFTGTFVGIDATGALQVKDSRDGALRHISSAEVFDL